jgi:hypothetical protein
MAQYPEFPSLQQGGVVRYTPARPSSFAMRHRHADAQTLLTYLKAAQPSRRSDTPHHTERHVASSPPYHMGGGATL